MEIQNKILEKSYTMFKVKIIIRLYVKYIFLFIICNRYIFIYERIFLLL